MQDEERAEYELGGMIKGRLTLTGAIIMEYDEIPVSYGVSVIHMVAGTKRMEVSVVLQAEDWTM